MNIILKNDYIKLHIIFMYSDIILALITGFFIYFGTKFVNYYYNFYHIYRYLDSYQKLNYFKNISIINYLNKNIDVKKKIIYYFFIPLIKLNYLIISLFVSIVYSLCEDDFTEYLQKKNLVLTSSNTNSNTTHDDNIKETITNTNTNTITNTNTNTYNQSELLINHDFLNTLNRDNIKESNNYESGEKNNDNYMMLNKYSSSSENSIGSIGSIGSNIISKDKKKNNFKNIDNFDSPSPEVNNQYELDISNELDLLKPFGTKNNIVLNEQEDNENIDNYIMLNEAKSNTNTESKFKSIGIIGKNNNIIKTVNGLDKNNESNIIETIRIDEIDFGDNLSNILNSDHVDKPNEKPNEKPNDKKTKEIKILPIKIGKKKN